jgi:hypothetical protein
MGSATLKRSSLLHREQNKTHIGSATPLTRQHLAVRGSAAEDAPLFCIESKEGILFVRLAPFLYSSAAQLFCVVSKAGISLVRLASPARMAVQAQDGLLFCTASKAKRPLVRLPHFTDLYCSHFSRAVTV